jgi:predicted Zn-dependent peptidase
MPERNTPEYYAMGLIDQLLLQGDDSLLHEELVKRRGYTESVEGGINLLGDMFDYKGPMLWIANLYHDNNVKPDDILAAMDAVIEPIRNKPIDQQSLDRALVKLRSSLYDDLGQFNGFGTADLLASFALFDDNPARINTLESEFRNITPEMIQKTAAEYLRTTNRTVLVVETEETPSPEKAGN